MRLSSYCLDQHHHQHRPHPSPNSGSISWGEASTEAMIPWRPMSPETVDEEEDRPSKICGGQLLSKILAGKNNKKEYRKKHSSPYWSETSSTSTSLAHAGENESIPSCSRNCEQPYLNLKSDGCISHGNNTFCTGRRVLGARKMNPKEIARPFPPSALLQCFMSQKKSALQNDSYSHQATKKAGNPMDEVTNHKKITPASGTSSVITVDPLVISEMKEQYLQNRSHKVKDSIRENDLSGREEGANLSTEKDDWKLVSSLFDLLESDTRVSDTVRLHAWESIKSIIKTREEKLRSEEKGGTLVKQAGKEVPPREQSQDNDMLAQLKWESEKYREEATSLREELDCIKMELHQLHKVLPDLHPSSKPKSQNFSLEWEPCSFGDNEDHADEYANVENPQDDRKNCQQQDVCDSPLVSHPTVGAHGNQYFFGNHDFRPVEQIQEKDKDLSPSRFSHHAIQTPLAARIAASNSSHSRSLRIAASNSSHSRSVRSIFRTSDSQLEIPFGTPGRNQNQHSFEESKGIDMRVSL